LRENHEHYRDLVENSLDLMCTHDLNGVLLTVNLAAARSLGYEPGELVNRNLREFLSPEVRDEIDAYLVKLRENGASSGFMKLLTRSGQTRTWKYTNTVRTEGVRVPVVRGIAHDFTDILRAQRALRESDERSSQIVQRSPIAMVVTYGLEQKNKLMNDKFTDLFGYSMADIPSVAEWWSLAYPNDAYREAVRAEWQEQVTKAIRNRSEIAPMEARVRCKDGSYRHIEFHFASLGETNLVSFVDLTDRTQAEEQQRESQGQLAGMIASAMDAIISVDDKQRIVLFNSSAEKMFGCRADEAIGSSIDRFIPERFRAEHSAHIRRFGESNVANRAMGMLGTVRGLRANGEEFPIEASISSVQAGAKKLFTAIIRDVSERLLAEDVLRESEERFRLVADTAPVLIWMAGTNKMCTYFNKGWLQFTGRSMEQELGERWLTGVHSDDLERCLDIYSRAFDGRVDFKMEYRLRRFDGEYRWIVDYGVPRFESNGTFCGYIGSCVDITDRKLTETSLRELGGRLIHAQEAERTRIARELHDDLSQGMALLAISLEQFNQSMPDLSPEAREELRKIGKIATDVSSDIHNLSHQLHPAKLDTLGLVASVKGFCREFSAQHKLPVQFVHHDIPGRIPKEVTLCLFRITQEALRNVVKHSGAAEAAVALSGSDGRIDLCISDSGAGFNPESAKGVAGLGLISMRERLRLVGGHLSIESEPSHGTRIRVSIPLH
jgi:PAS domain S-box-containing protein